MTKQIIILIITVLIGITLSYALSQANEYRLGGEVITKETTSKELEDAIKEKEDAIIAKEVAIKEKEDAIIAKEEAEKIAEMRKSIKAKSVVDKRTGEVLLDNIIGSGDVRSIILNGEVIYKK